MAPEDKFNGMPPPDADIEGYMHEVELKAARDISHLPTPLDVVHDVHLEDRIIRAYADARGVYVSDLDLNPMLRQQILENVFAYRDRRQQGNYILEIPVDEEEERNTYLAVGPELFQKPN